MSNILSDFADRLKAFFHTVEGDVERFAYEYLPKVEDLLEVAFEDLAEFAGRAILTQAPLVISGQEKFGNAVADVIQSVEAKGKTILLQTAQAAVQSAFLLAKAALQGK